MVVLLGGLLRFYRLGEIPLSLDWDEVSLGYNAWALSETGKDEFGNSWPLSIRSFGDYKPPVYTYLLIPAIKIFGRTEFAVRFPSALAGTLTVLMTYFLAGTLLRFNLAAARLNLLKLTAAFLIAISPWHLQFSRIAFEANVGLFFFVAGMWLLIRALRRSLPWSLFLAVVSMSAGMMTYHSVRLVIPLVVLGVLLIYKKQLLVLLRPGFVMARPGLFKKSAPIILSVVLTILTISTIFYIFFQQKVGQSRLREISFLTISDLLTVSSSRIERFSGSILDRAANHRFLVYTRQFISGYLDHFNLRFWFLQGDGNDRHRAPGVGLVYFWEFPLLVTGLMSLIGHMSPMAAKEKAVLFLWILVAPSSSALTGGTPSAVRSLVFLPTFQIIEGAGVVWLIRRIRQISRIWRILVVSCYLLVVTFEISYYFHQYYIQSPPETAPAWQYGYKQLVNKVMSEKDNYQKVIVTTAYDQPYIYFMWYGNYDPKLWINDGEFNKRFDKFEFKLIEWRKLDDLNNVLVISPSVQTDKRPIKWQINFPDGKTAFYATEL